MKKTCIGCNQPFESNYPQSKFCSKQCKETPCTICGKMMNNPRRTRKFCSNRCKGLYQSQNMLGENNPNFGKKWDNKRRKSQSDLVKSKVNDEYRFKAGSANRGKKFSKDRIEKMHGHRTPDTYGVYGKGHTEKTKKIIGEKSRRKFTSDYKKEHRKRMELAGHWIPLEYKADYEIYFSECNWIDKMFDVVENGIETVEEYGVFNNKTNKNGVVRDHILGRKYGYAHGIFPEIMRHPANCQILHHGKNVSKGQRGKGRPDTDITIEELFDRIIEYDKFWIEQEVCLERIGEYNEGKRWRRKEVKCVSESE